VQYSPLLPPDLIHTLSLFLKKRGVRLGNISIREPALEEVFIGLTKKALRD
jgi:hypothetical protein